MVGITTNIRPAVADDAEACGRTIYDAFKGIADAYGFPPDFPSVEAGTQLATMLIGRAKEPEERVTEGDLRALAADAERTGGIEAAEHRMITGVLRLGDRQVRAVMTSRDEVDCIDAAAGTEAARGVALRSPHSRLPYRSVTGHRTQQSASSARANCSPHCCGARYLICGL